MSRRKFVLFEYHQANYRIFAPDQAIVLRSIRRSRNRLESYLLFHPEFAETRIPLNRLPEPAPESARRMHRASLLTGVGPMAAVAGTFAQLAVEESLSARNEESSAGSGREYLKECIVENGGDIFMRLQSELILGLWPGESSSFSELSFLITPDQSPLAVCSSSSSMGHSHSYGSCELATVFSEDAALADACATAVCNRVTGVQELQGAVEWAARIEGIRGLLAIKADKMAVAGALPQLLRHRDPELRTKITRHHLSTEL